jgi:hypothetical protein
MSSSKKDNFKSPQPNSASKQGLSDKPTAATTGKPEKKTVKIEESTEVVEN